MRRRMILKMISGAITGIAMPTRALLSSSTSVGAAQGIVAGASLGGNISLNPRTESISPDILAGTFYSTRFHIANDQAFSHDHAIDELEPYLDVFEFNYDAVDTRSFCFTNRGGGPKTSMGWSQQAVTVFQDDFPPIDAINCAAFPWVTAFQRHLHTDCGIIIDGISPRWGRYHVYITTARWVMTKV